MKEKIFKLKDGGIITASTLEEFVTKLRKSSRFDSECSDEEYMSNFARRYKVQEGYVIKIDTEVNFVEDLIKIGYIIQ
jgi:hypothetical protein